MEKPTEKQRAEVRQLIKKWRPILFIDIWQIDLHFVEECSSPDAVCYVKMQHEYANVVIEINTDLFFNEDKQKREEIIVHELCHILIEPAMDLVVRASVGKQVTDDEFDRVKESVTQHITRSLFYNNN